MRCYHQYQVDPCVFYRNQSVILTYIDGFIIVSHKQETIISLIEPLKNGPEKYVLTHEGEISNYLGANIKKHSDVPFKSSLSNLVEKFINFVGLTVSASPKSIDTPIWKSLLNENKASLGRTYVCKYWAAVSMLSYLQGST